MMDFRVGDETMSWFRDAYPLVERFISEGGYRLYPDSIVVSKEIKNVDKNFKWGCLSLAGIPLSVFVLFKSCTGW